MATLLINGTPRPIPATRVFNQAAWAGPLATMTLEDWKRAGGCGPGSLVESRLCALLRMPGRKLAKERLIELVTYGWAGRVLERGMARFSVDNTEQLKPEYRGLAGMVTWEYDQRTGAQIYFVAPEPEQ